MSVFWIHLCSPKPEHTTKGACRGAEQSGCSESGSTGSRHNSLPRQRMSFIPPKTFCLRNPRSTEVKKKSGRLAICKQSQAEPEGGFSPRCQHISATNFFFQSLDDVTLVDFAAKTCHGTECVALLKSSTLLKIGPKVDRSACTEIKCQVCSLGHSRGMLRIFLALQTEKQIPPSLIGGQDQRFASFCSAG